MKNKQEKQDHLNGWQTHTTANAAASPTFLSGRSVSLQPFHVLRLTILDTCGELFLVLRHAELDNISNREVTKTGNARFEVLTAPLLRIQIFWDVTLCSSVEWVSTLQGQTFQERRQFILKRRRQQNPPTRDDPPSKDRASDPIRFEAPSQEMNAQCNTEARSDFTFTTLNQ